MKKGSERMKENTAVVCWYVPIQHNWATKLQYRMSLCVVWKWICAKNENDFWTSAMDFYSRALFLNAGICQHEEGIWRIFPRCRPAYEESDLSAGCEIQKDWQLNPSTMKGYGFSELIRNVWRYMDPHWRCVYIPLLVRKNSTSSLDTRDILHFIRRF